MYRTKQCAAVVPCLNEARTIGPLVIALREQLPAVIVVDDGSSDGTRALATDAGAIVVRHEEPRGKGAALTAGLRRARELGFTHALTLDGDGQHSPADVGAFLSRADSTGAPLIVGNRMGDAQRMPWLRRQVNRWMSRKLSRRTGIELPDSQCGFRLVQLADWSTLEFCTAHFEYESEMLCAFADAGLHIEFVPVQVIYRRETSKIHPWRDTIRWFRWLAAPQRKFNPASPRSSAGRLKAARPVSAH